LTSFGRNITRALILGLIATTGAWAQVKLPAIFGDHMVLQGDKTIPVWGTASPGEKIKVSLGHDHASVRADAQGKWRVDLKKIAPSNASLMLTVSGRNKVELSDVLIGDVWVASGQSNMEFGIKDADTGQAALKTANQPMIRLFVVPKRPAAYPEADIDTKSAASPLQGKWQLCTPETLANEAPTGFSAVAYFFGRNIQRFTGKPVGLIATVWGGSVAESWISLDGLEKEPTLEPRVLEHKQLLAHYDAAVAAYPAALADYNVKNKEWTDVSQPQNVAAMKQWQVQADAATAAGQTEPPKPKLIDAPVKPDPSGGRDQPTNLFNGMIAPLLPYAIKGVIWYQGEGNGAHGAAYRATFAALITDWRSKWNEGDFPFLFVQLPEYHGAWGPVRESQLHTLSLPNTGMVVAIDVGLAENVHPPFKEVVGNRLALVTEHVAYGKDLVYSGPIYSSMQVQGDAIKLAFDHIGGGLMIGHSPVSGHDFVPAPIDRLVTFTIAGEDKQWFPAEAKIEGNMVIVSSPQVPHPVAVRYGWDPPAICNLYNQEGLPASPFRTDTWLP